MTDEEKKNTFVTVCDKCFQASCWHGVFMCYEAKFAGTVVKSIAELEDLNLENPCYWVEEEGKQ